MSLVDMFNWCFSKIFFGSVSLLVADMNKYQTIRPYQPSEKESFQHYVLGLRENRFLFGANNSVFQACIDLTFCQMLLGTATLFESLSFFSFLFINHHKILALKLWGMWSTPKYVHLIFLKCHGYGTKLHLMVKLQSLSFGGMWSTP